MSLNNKLDLARVQQTNNIPFTDGNIRGSFNPQIKDVNVNLNLKSTPTHINPTQPKYPTYIKDIPTFDISLDSIAVFRDRDMRTDFERDLLQKRLDKNNALNTKRIESKSDLYKPVSYVVSNGDLKVKDLKNIDYIHFNEFEDDNIVNVSEQYVKEMNVSGAEGVNERNVRQSETNLNDLTGYSIKAKDRKPIVDERMLRYTNIRPQLTEGQREELANRITQSADFKDRLQRQKEAEQWFLKTNHIDRIQDIRNKNKPIDGDNDVVTRIDMNNRVPKLKKEIEREKGNKVIEKLTLKEQIMLNNQKIMEKFKELNDKVKLNNAKIKEQLMMKNKSNDIDVVMRFDNELSKKKIMNDSRYKDIEKHSYKKGLIQDTNYENVKSEQRLNLKEGKRDVDFESKLNDILTNDLVEYLKKERIIVKHNNSFKILGFENGCVIYNDVDINLLQDKNDRLKINKINGVNGVKVLDLDYKEELEDGLVHEYSREDRLKVNDKFSRNQTEMKEELEDGLVHEYSREDRLKVSDNERELRDEFEYEISNIHEDKIRKDKRDDTKKIKKVKSKLVNMKKFRRME